MYTVILYWQEKMPGGRALVPDYCDFLFSYAQIQDRTLRRAYTGPGALRHTVRALEQTLGQCEEWRLILFDGRPAAPGEENGLLAPDTIRREWTSLLLYISGEAVEAEKRLRIVPPQEVWYLGCSEQGVYTAMGQSEFAYGKLLLTREEIALLRGQPPAEQRENEVLFPCSALDAASIPSLRMCWTEVQPGAGVIRRQEVFRLCCMLLVLAGSELSPGLMHSGYLYKIRLDVDWRRLSAEMGRLRGQNAALETLVQKAWADYRQTRQRFTSYLFPRNLYKPHISAQPGELRKHKLKLRDLKRGAESELERKMQRTRQWLRAQFVSPEVYEQLTQPVRLEEENRGVPLDAMGLDSVRTELNRSIRRLYQIRQAGNSPLRLEKDLAEAERKIFDCVEDRATAHARRPMIYLLAVLEAITFAAFCMKPLERLIRFLIRFFPAVNVQPFFGDNMRNFLLFLAAATVIFGLTLVLFRVYSLFLDWLTISFQYNNCLDKSFSRQGKERKQGATLMREILLYRYHCALLERQRTFKIQGEQQKEHLQHHEAFQKNAAGVCEQVELVLGETVPQASGEIPRVPFSREPDPADYFWRPIGERSMTCDLNHSGYPLEVYFDFITNVSIYRTAALRVLESPLNWPDGGCED